MMTKKDFVAVAAALNPLYRDDLDGNQYEWSADSMEDVLMALCQAFQELNPQFKADRFRAAVCKETR